MGPSMTIDEAIARLTELKSKAGSGGVFLEVKQLNGMDRTVNSMQLIRSDLPHRECVLIFLEDEAVHG